MAQENNRAIDPTRGGVARMTDRNVFAPPKASLIDRRSTEGCTREGKDVIIQRGSDLPQRCVYCNEPAVTPIKRRKVYWHTSWLYLLIVINLFVYAIVAIIVRKSFEVSPGLCEAHNSRRNGWIWGLFGAAILLAVAGVVVPPNGIGPLLFVLAFVALISIVFAARILYPREITKEYAKLRGCKEPFLASIE
jgi:hypothetical protein